MAVEVWWSCRAVLGPVLAVELALVAVAGRSGYQPDNRPDLAALMDQLRAGDTVVVWKLDRLGRNTLQYPGDSQGAYRAWGDPRLDE